MPLPRGCCIANVATSFDELIVETKQDLIAAVHGEVKIIDLSPDFRLDDSDTYAEWYGISHGAAALQPRAIYGLSEFARDDIATTNLVACPGCYPTASLLPLLPLLRAGLIEQNDIIIDAKSGVSGAGRAAKEANLFAEVSEGIHAYGVGGHRHLPEIEQELGKAAAGPIKVNFTPHLMPMNRGILSTIYVKLAAGADADALRDGLISRFDDEPFVYVVPGRDRARDAPCARIEQLLDRGVCRSSTGPCGCAVGDR